MVLSELYLLKPCRGDKSYTLKLKDQRVSGNDVLKALLASPRCKLLAHTKVLSVLDLEGTVISVHFRGEMLLRQIPSREHADAVAAKVMDIINTVKRGQSIEA